MVAGATGGVTRGDSVLLFVYGSPSRIRIHASWVRKRGGERNRSQISALEHSSDGRSSAWRLSDERRERERIGEQQTRRRTSRYTGEIWSRREAAVADNHRFASYPIAEGINLPRGRG